MACPLWRVLKMLKRRTRQSKLVAQVAFLLLLATTASVSAFVFNVDSAGPVDLDEIETDSIPRGSLDAWDSKNFDETLISERLAEWNGLVQSDEDSVELVLGVKESFPSVQNRILEVVEANHGVIVNEVWIGNKLNAVVVDLPFSSVSPFVTSLPISEFTSYVEPNARFHADSEPDDPYYDLQWSLRRTEVDWAWNTTIGDHSILVAVVDTGVYWNHSDIMDNYVPLGYDWVNDDNDPMDDEGHGTHCAGIIGATFNNSVGIAGIAQAKIFAEKGLDKFGLGTADDLANAIVHAVEQNASIVNLSWSGSFNSKLIRDAIKYAYDSNVLLVAAAGNTRTDVKAYPAAYEEVIAVSATDQNDDSAFFTNFGRWIELAAPGVQVYSTVLEDKYEYRSGTSMSSPHIVGVSALVWSLFPNMTRDQLRYHMGQTADDLGDIGFDEYYGKGRINAAQAVNQSLPAHDLAVTSLESPPYVELGDTGVFNATVLNYGINDEVNVTVQLFVNDTFVWSNTISSLESGYTAKASLYWTATVEGLHNINVTVLPAQNESNVENNLVEARVYAGTPTKVFVVRSAGTYWTWITATWEKLNQRWFEFGNTSIFVDSSTLNKENFVYEDLAVTQADVLVVSSAYSPDLGWEYSDTEIDAITRYVYEGHGLIVTANTFHVTVPNNSKLARLVGVDETTVWNTTLTSGLQLLQPQHPIFRSIPNPYNIASRETSVPHSGWTGEVLAGGEIVALGTFNESAIVTYRGLVYSSPAVESYSSRNDLQLLYNAMTWTRYVKPQHDLIATLDAPPFLLPGQTTVLNATVSNLGVYNETNMDLQLLINGSVVENVTLGELAANGSNTVNHPWSTLEIDTYNITVIVPPKIQEENLLNNRITRLVKVSNPLIQPEEGQWATYTLRTFKGDASTLEVLNFTYNHYVSPLRINVTYGHSSMGYKWTTSSIINIMNRRVEQGAWLGMFYPGWIETQVNLGSKVQILNGVGTIVNSQKTFANNQSIMVWSLFVDFQTQNYTFHFDKVSGLLVGYDRFTSVFQEQLRFTQSNFIVGALFYPKPGDQALYSLVHWTNNSVTAHGNMSFRHLEYLDSLRTQVQVSHILVDAEGQLVENSTHLMVVNIQTRLVENTSHPWNNTYCFNWIETDIAVGDQVKILNQTGTVIGSTRLKVEQRVFDTWLIYNVNQTQLRHWNYDKASGLMVKSTVQDLNMPSTNVTYTLLQTNVDVNSPTITVTSPEDNSFIAATSFEVEWTGFDNETGISHIILHVDSSEIATLPGNASSLLISNITEGPHLIKVEAYDLAFNVAAAEVTVTVDVTEPSVHISFPSNNSHVNDIVPIGFDGDDIWLKNIQLYVNNVFESQFITKGDHTYLWNTTLNQDGKHVIRIVATDEASNTAMQQVTVTVDNTSPNVQIVELDQYVSGVVNVTVVAYDLNLKNVSLIVNNQTIGIGVSSGYYTYTWAWDTTDTFSGDSKVEAKVFDEAGNSAAYSLQVVVDNAPPSVMITSPANHSCVGGVVDVDLMFSDENLLFAELAVDGELLTDATNTTSVRWNTNEIADGKHALALRAVDKAGNFKESVVTVVTDNTNPIVFISAPADFAMVSGNLSITFFTWDQNLKNATLTVGQTSNAFNVLNKTRVIFDTLTVQDGAYTVGLATFDQAGNQAEAQVTITVDNTDPQVTIESPSDGAHVHGVVYVNFTANDVNLATVFLHIDNMVLDVNAQTSIQWDTSKLGDDVHSIRIVAVDKAGNTGEAKVEVSTVNRQKELEESYMSGIILGILVGLILGLVASFLAVFAAKLVGWFKTSKPLGEQFVNRCLPFHTKRKNRFCNFEE